MSALAPEQLACAAYRPLPALRLLPVPVSEPPYDDELPVSAAGPGPSRALGPLRSLGLLRLVPEPASDDETEAGPTRPQGVRLPPARPVAHALAQGLLEVVAGVRPLAQLRTLADPELYARLERNLRLLPRAGGVRPTGGAVRSLHVQERPEGVAEVCATVRRGARSAAVAFRLDAVDGAWRCTELVGF